MAIKELFGTWLPFIGWRDLPDDIVAQLADVIDGINPNHRYSSFQIAWLGFTFSWGLNDKGSKGSAVV